MDTVDYPLLNLFFTMLMFFLFFIWIYLLIMILMDIFRSHDMGGWAKAAWVVFIIILPFLGVLIYLIARGQSMQERGMKQYAEQQKAQQAYIRDVAGEGGSNSAEEIAKLAQLRDQGVLTEDEFQAQKAKVLA